MCCFRFGILVGWVWFCLFVGLIFFFSCFCFVFLSLSFPCIYGNYCGVCASLLRTVLGTLKLGWGYHRAAGKSFSAGGGHWVLLGTEPLKEGKALRGKKGSRAVQHGPLSGKRDC